MLLLVASFKNLFSSDGKKKILCVSMLLYLFLELIILIILFDYFAILLLCLKTAIFSQQ